MKVISNSSILIGLSAIGRLELLHQRFPEGVTIPDAVWAEVVETGHGRTGAALVGNAEWIFRKQVQNKAFSNALRAYLDQGEAEVIALGQEIGADLLLLDEKSARSVAARLQQPVLGTVGVLIWAKRKQIISSLSSELTRLRQKGGFRVSKAVYEYALEQAGE
jgi:uncharacterized protein